MADALPLPSDEAVRLDLIHWARELNRRDLTRNTSGNISRRVEGGFLLTPTGMDYERLEPEDIVFIDWLGEPCGRRLPSSEWRFHLDLLLTRQEIGCVLHGHPPFATSLACHRRGIPSFHYMVAKAGGVDIRCAPYATYGTEALSRHALKALEGRKACLLANHGFIVLGATPETAMILAVEVETLAEMYWRALQIGEPALLDADEMALVVEKFRTYGYQPPLG